MNSAPKELSDYEKALERELDSGRVLLVNGAIVDTSAGHEAMFAQLRAADRRAMEKSGPPPEGWRAPKTEDERLRAAHDFIAAIKSRANFADSLAKGSVTEQVRAPDLAEMPSPPDNAALAQSTDDPSRLTDLGLVERAAAAICEREHVSRLQALDRLADDFNFGSWMELAEAFESGEPIPMPDVTNEDTGLPMPWLDLYVDADPDAYKRLLRSVEPVKKAAKLLKKRDGIAHAQALHAVAQTLGFKTFDSLRRAVIAGERIVLPVSTAGGKHPIALWLDTFR